ncbi:MAG: sensor histidine kinase [Roseburia sp.]|nr:sensor histidine kinase [Roseburia sp.]MCM1099622.1 sensor histidine kinase [Ruminococcus flavefaciens]
MMRKRFYQMIRDLSLKRKIIGICLIVSLIPMTILGLFLYRQTSRMLLDQTRSALGDALRQETDHIGYKLDTYLAMMDFVAADAGIERALTRDYRGNYEMYITYRDTIDPLLEAVRVLNRGLERATFYSDAGIYPHGTVLRPLSEAEGQPWYEKTMSSFSTRYTFSEDGKTLYLTRQVYLSESDYTNLLVIAADVPEVLGGVRTIYADSFGFALLDESGRPVYQFEKFSDSMQKNHLTAEELLSKQVPRDYVLLRQTMEQTGWTAVLYRPMREMRSGVGELIGTVLLLIVCSCLLVFFLGAGLTALVARPITALAENMRGVEQGDYRLLVTPDRHDEVGRLIESFQAMVKQLNHLINEVLYARIEAQKYELRILQSQINPHFLYNSLSLISSRAIRCGQEDISRLAQLLAAFYRTMLNKGRTNVTIAEELENVRAYISIQQIMHSHSFETVYEVDPALLECTMPNMLLQPLAENAILHGLDNREAPGMGILTIRCQAEGEDIVFQVMDNGRGMSEEQCRRIVTVDSRGYGVKNVHQRVQLYYGERYGLAYRSALHRGSCALLRIGRGEPEDAGKSRQSGEKSREGAGKSRENGGIPADNRSAEKL